MLKQVEQEPQVGRDNQEVINYVASAVEPYLDDKNPFISTGCSNLLHRITQDAEQGLIVGLTPKFIDKAVDDDGETPDDIYVQTFAEGHYPLAPPNTGLFGHDMAAHFRTFRKLGRDKDLSERIQSQAQMLVERLKQSKLDYTDPRNADLRQDYEDFVGEIDSTTTGDRYDKVAEYILYRETEEGSLLMR